MFRATVVLLLALSVVGSAAGPARSQTIIDEWQSVKAPPAPQLKNVLLDAKTTAFLVMDLVKQSCNEQRRPRCVASIPKIGKLVAAARAKGVMLVFTTVPPIPITDTVPGVGRKGDEPIVTAWVDKFTLDGKDTGLDKMLKDRGIKSVIVVGTAAHGAVLYTGSEAALRGFDVIVPVDGMSADAQNTYVDQYVTYNFSSAPVVSAKVTLTSTDMIKFQ